MKKLFIALLALLFLMTWAYLMFMPKKFVNTGDIKIKAFEEAEEEYQKYEDSIKVK